MEPYKIKHVKTGLYYKTGINNLTEKGKVYASGNNVITHNSSKVVKAVLRHNTSAFKKYSTLLDKYKIWTNPGVATAYNIPKEEFVKETLCSWRIIPEEKLKSYIGIIPKSNIICECGELNEGIPGYPYAYDMDSDDVIYAHQCKKCGKILYTRD